MHSLIRLECEREKRQRIDAAALALLPHLLKESPTAAAIIAYNYAVALETERGRSHYGEEPCKPA